MPLHTHATAVLLPGSGSDANFVRRAFAPVTALCADSVSVDAQPPSVVASYWRALDDAAASGPVIVCGVSLGSAVAAKWALAHPDAGVSLVLTLPPWSGAAGADTPAAASALITADTVDEVGADEAIRRMQAGSPSWLASELTRSWAAHGPFLASALREAACYVAPSLPELETLRADTVVIGAAGDAIHPVTVARAWGERIPGARTEVVNLSELGAAPDVLGRTAVAAFTSGRSDGSEPIRE